MNPLADRRAQLLVLASGVCALSYQSAWIRQLRLLFGASTAASAAVLGIFMGGLGLGAWRLANRVQQSENPLALYARLEAGVAVFALASIPLLAGARALYIGLGGEAELGGPLALALRLVLAAAVLGTPAYLMGGTLPAIIRATIGEDDGPRRSVARLYGLNTLGAVLGVVLTTFWSLEHLGISRTILAAVALNLACAAWAAWAARGARNPSPASNQAASPQPKREPTSGAAPSPRPTPLIWLASAVFGFVFFSMELVWYRVLAPLTGGTTYGFGFVLGTALAGIGVGGLLYARRQHAHVGLAALALSALLEALGLVLAWVLGDQIVFAAAQLRAITILGSPGLYAYWLALNAVVVLPAAIVAGYQFPLLVACIGRGREGVGRDVAIAYAFNTAGAVAGAIFTGFGLIVLIGTRGLWIACVLLLLATSLALLVAARREAPAPQSSPGRRGFLAPLGLASLCLAALVWGDGPTAIWMHNPIGAGRLDWNDDMFQLRAELEQARSDLVWSADGKESSVAILGRNAYAFRVNGKTDGNATGDAATVVMAPLLAALLHPEPKHGLVIGLGTGMSAGWLAQVETMQTVDVVELEPALVEFARMCAPVNHNVLDNPRVNLVIGDAREWVQSADRRWDVIMSEPSNPYRAGIASLFSVDFYARVAERMAPDGIFVQWLQGYEVDGMVIATVLASLRTVFVSVDVFVTSSGDYALVARRTDTPFDLVRIAGALKRAPYEAGLAQTWGVRDVEGLFAAHIAGPGLADAMFNNPAIEVERDDRPRLEFGFARTLGGDAFVSSREILDAASRVNAGTPIVRGRFDEALRDEARHVLSYTMQNDLGREYVSEDPSAEARRTARIANARGEYSDALQAWTSQAQAPYFIADQLMMGGLWADDGDAIRTKAMIQALQKHRPIDAVLLRARLARARGDEAELVSALVDAFTRAREDPWFDEGQMLQALRRLVPFASDEAPRASRELFDALGPSFAVDILGESRMRARLQLARSLDFAELCVATLAALEPHPPFDEDFLQARVDCYEANQDPRLPRAQAEMRAYSAMSESPTLGAWIVHD